LSPGPRRIVEANRRSDNRGRQTVYSAPLCPDFVTRDLSGFGIARRRGRSQAR
jgi:hypothetical protein